MLQQQEFICVKTVWRIYVDIVMKIYEDDKHVCAQSYK